MKRKRSLRGWCGLGLAIAAVAGGAYAGKRYAEQHMLATVLGSGVHADSVQWHWRQAAGCAEHVEIPLPHATDAHDQPLQLYAPKLWFVYDQAALLRKRFILPRVVMEDVVISTANDRLLDEGVVDIDFEPVIELGDLVELPSDATVESSLANSADAKVGQVDSSTALIDKAMDGLASGISLPWVEQLQTLCDSTTNDKAIQGRQVSIDADMLSERVQGYFADSRVQAQKLVAEARDMQQQLVDMDNVLRQPQLTEISRRLEQINEQLIKLKVDIGHSGKSLDEEHSRLRSALLVEKTQLLRQADEYTAPSAQEVAQTILIDMVNQQLDQPVRAVVIMADLMRKPLDATASGRGQPIRHRDQQQPEFAARSARMRGKAEIGDKAWPFEAEGSFELSASSALAASSEREAGSDRTDEMPKTSGSSQWHMKIEAQADAWQLDGQCPSIDGPCKIAFTSSSAGRLTMDCQVAHTKISGDGQMDLRQLIGMASLTEAVDQATTDRYRHGALLSKLLSDALVVDDQTPETIHFDAPNLDQRTVTGLNEAAVVWLADRMQITGTVAVADGFRRAAAQLDKLIANKMTDHKSLMATLRNDTEQYVSNQQDELRRIQASVNSLIEQRQANYYFARQPGGAAR